MNFTEADKMKIRSYALELGAKIEDADSIMDWKIDKDWNLAEHECKGSLGSLYFWKSDIKKCRDLILKDLEYSNLCGNQTEEIKTIIHKRFGDLK